MGALHIEAPLERVLDNGAADRQVALYNEVVSALRRTWPPDITISLDRRRGHPARLCESRREETR